MNNTNNKKGVKTAKKQLPGKPFTKDDPRINRDGRPKGTENFKTKWERFVKKVADQNKLLPEDIDEQLLAVAYKKAKEGDYSFFRDIHDRVYGKPVQPTENNHTGELNISFDSSFNE